MKDYKKILEGVVNIVNTTEKSDIGFDNISAYIGENCPELRESEDEKIRKDLIEWIEEFPDMIWRTHYKKDVIAWLEKQGGQKPADKFEPKFKVGDKIRIKAPSSCDKDMQVARIEKDYYICNHIGKFSSEVVPFSKQSSYELIEQKPTWSAEDDRIYYNLLADIRIRQDGSTNALEAYCNEQIKWLKSIKERYTWKPSGQ